MATVRKVVRVANPARHGRFRLRARAHKRRRSSNPGRRRRMSPAQIRHFGTKRQKAALKAARKRKRSHSHHARTSNPRPKVKVIYRYKNASRPKRRRAHRRSSNPALVVTLGSVNPKRRKKSVAKARRVRRSRSSNRRRSNPRHYRRRVARHRRRSSNRRRVAVMNPRRHIRRRRRSNPRHHRRASYRRSRNPNLFGGKSTKTILKISGGVLAGVFITKSIPRYIPASITGSIGSGSVMAVVVSFGSALAAGYLGKMIDPEFGEGALWGGIAQAISVALNAFLPQVGGVFSLGDLVSGNFVVPQNPIRAGMMAPASIVAAAKMSGMGAAAFPRAF